MALFSYEPAPKAEAWTSQWKSWLSKLRDYLVSYHSVIDLTDATSDYDLKIGQVAKIDITTTSTALNTTIEDGVYDIYIMFDATTFGTEQHTQLLPNGTTFSNEFNIVGFLAETAVATDEVDVANDETTFDNFYLQGFPGAFNMRPWSIKATVFKNGATASIQSFSHGYATNSRLQLIGMDWQAATPWTSLGTLNIAEAATGVCYVKRIA